MPVVPHGPEAVTFTVDHAAKTRPLPRTTSTAGKIHRLAVFIPPRAPDFIVFAPGYSGQECGQRLSRRRLTFTFGLTTRPTSAIALRSIWPILTARLVGRPRKRGDSNRASPL